MKQIMLHSDLVAALAHIDTSTLKNVRYSPTSFDPKDPTIALFPRPRSAWISAGRALALFKSQIVMARLPLFWQLHSPLHAECRGVSAAMYSNMQNNSPLGIAAVRELGVDTIVSDAKMAELFAHEMRDAGTQAPLSWIIIHSPQDEWNLSSNLIERSAHEVHLFPGVVLLQQCEHVIATGKRLFHLSGDFEWTISDDTVVISGGGPFALDNYLLPFRLVESGICTCGDKLFTKAA